MTNNAMPRLKIKLKASAGVFMVLPKCPASIMLDGGGSVSTKVLDDETLHRIADAWRDNFIAKARKSSPTPED